MRHGIMHKKLGRTHQHRQALLLNLQKSFFNHGKIETTITKAKLIRPIVESLITKARGSDLSTIRYLSSKLHGDQACLSNLRNLGEIYANRNGGYTRIVRTYVRQDKTQMAVIERV